VTFAACLGIAATYYGLGALIDRYDWPVAFLICSGLTLGVAIVWSLGTRSARHAQSRDAIGADDANHALRIHAQSMPPQPAASMWRMLGRRGVVCITLSYAALGYFQYLFFYWIEYYFKEIEKRGPEIARQYTTLITLAMGVGMVCGGFLADRVPAS